MTDRIREQMSALLDGELPENEVGLLVRRLERDAELRRSFGHYVLAGETLQSPGGVLASAGFAARVSAAIAADAGQVAPVESPRTSERHWSRPFAAVAVAASAAFMAVMLVRPGAQGPGTIAQVTLERARSGFASLQVETAATPTPAHSQRLASYLMAHSQFASPLGRRNVWSGVLASDPGIGRVAFETIEAP